MEIPKWWPVEDLVKDCPILCQTTWSSITKKCSALEAKLGSNLRWPFFEPWSMRSHHPKHSWSRHILPEELAAMKWKNSMKQATVSCCYLRWCSSIRSTRPLPRQKPPWFCRVRNCCLKNIIIIIKDSITLAISDQCASFIRLAPRRRSCIKISWFLPSTQWPSCLRNSIPKIWRLSWPSWYISSCRKSVFHPFLNR